MEEGSNTFKMLTDKPTGKSSLRRPRRRWEDNIRMDIKEIDINTRNWVDLTQDRGYWRALVNAALNPRVFEVKTSLAGFGRGKIYELASS